MNTKIFKQLDSRWSSLPYPTKKSTFGGNGCGCCACVHIAIEQPAKADWTPENLRKWMIDQGFVVAGNGTTWQGITSTLKHIGHKSVVCVWNDPMSSAWAELNKGNRIGILLVSNAKTPDGTYWTASGHYVAFTDYKVENGKHWFYIKDSGGRNHDGWFCYEKSIKGALPKLWIVERLDAPQPTPEPTPEDEEHYKGAYPNPKKYLEKGDRGTEVTKLQDYLDWYFEGQFFEECGPSDGIFGKNTDKWTKMMQTDFFGAKEADGKVGPKTISRMKKVTRKASPSLKTTKMIDVSEFQKTINWSKVKAAGIQAVIIRCAGRGAEKGNIYDDANFVTNIKGAHNVGLSIGIYFLTQAINAAEGKEEAQYAINVWKKTGVPLAYPICIDSEDVSWKEKGKIVYGRAHSKKLSKAKRTEAVKAFAEECKRQGYESMIYASTSWLYNQVDMSILSPLMSVWVAQWSSSCDYKGKYIIWQYSDKGSVSGIKTKVDMDKCYI